MLNLYTLRYEIFVPTLREEKFCYVIRSACGKIRTAVGVGKL